MGQKRPKCLPYGPKIYENLTKCLLEGVCAHPGCCKKIDLSAENRVLTHENGPKRTFSRKCTCKPIWPKAITLVVLCIKLWLVRGGGTVRLTNASFWLPFGHVILGSNGT
jgi:hypothetical protein